MPAGTDAAADAARPSRCRAELPAVVVLALTILLAGCARSQAQPPRPPAQAMLMRCTPQTVSRLYFGFDTPEGPVSEAAWRAFVQSDIAPRLPGGFTLLAASGQWRGEDGLPRQEESRVLEVVGHDDAAHRLALAEIVGRYKTRFRQQSVLVTQSPTRACE